VHRSLLCPHTSFLGEKKNIYYITYKKTSFDASYDYSHEFFVLYRGHKKYIFTLKLFFTGIYFENLCVNVEYPDEHTKFNVCYL
jgi:hypothetical protein